MKYLLIILFPFYLAAQEPIEILQDFAERTYIPPDWRDFGPPCPWQSIRHSFREALQIDVHVNKKELDVLISDRHIIYSDLILFYLGVTQDAFQVVQRGNYVKVHTAANPYPHLKFWEIQHAENYLHGDNPYFGWHWGTMAGGKVAVAVKELGKDKWHVSFALLMKFKGYGSATAALQALTLNPAW